MAKDSSTISKLLRRLSRSPEPADSKETSDSTTGGGCPFAASGNAMPANHPDVSPQRFKPMRPVPVNVVFGTHNPSSDQTELLEAVGGHDTIHRICTKFYSRAFEDSVLQKFMFEDDGAEAHGRRLADWIVEKMTGEQIWTNTRPPNSRSASHRQAWNSEKRPQAQRGQRFKLDDCRVWMRLMFWAAREEGLSEHASFWNWYVGFIGHFIAVYERTAPPYAAESAAWSADPKNLAKYARDGNHMDGVVGVGRSQYW